MLAPREPRYRAELAAHLLRSGRRQQAIATWKALLELDPGSKEAAEALAQLR